MSGDGDDDEIGQVKRVRLVEMIGSRSRNLWNDLVDCLSATRTRGRGRVNASTFEYVPLGAVEIDGYRECGEISTNG